MPSYSLLQQRCHFNEHLKKNIDEISKFCVTQQNQIKKEFKMIMLTHWYYFETFGQL